jgi:DNA-binding MarR family transcriptional regulator
VSRTSSIQYQYPGRQVWESFIDAHAAVFKRLEDEIQREAGMELSWFDVLVHLDRADDGRMNLQDLTNSVLLTQSGLSRLVDRMHRAGLVRKETSNADRRAVLVSLTPAGRAAFRRAYRVHLRGIEEHFVQHLTADEAAAMTEALRKVLQAATE